MESQSEQEESQEIRCFHCQKQATFACGGDCAGKTGEHSKIRACYCSSTCQNADLKVHQGLCNAGKLLRHIRTRKKLYAAARILRDVFYASSESTFGFNVSRAERKDGKIHLYTSPDHKWKPPFKFPTRFDWTEDERNKLLSFGRCADAHVVTQGLLQKLLGDLYCRARMLVLVLTSYEQSVVVHGPEIFDTGGSHNVWFLHLEDGSSFIIDLAGAQFGHHDIIVPETRYEMLYQPRHQHSIGVDYVRDEYASQLSGPFGAFLLGDAGAAMAKRDLQSGQIIDETAEEWERANMITLAELLYLPDQELYDKSSSLIELIKANLDQHWMEDRGHVDHGIGHFIRKHMGEAHSQPN